VRVSDAELEAALGGPVERRAWERSSSVPLELVTAAGRGPFVLKPTTGGTRPAHIVDPAREHSAYALLPADLGVPALIADGPGWLLIELVDGVPLAEVGELAAWEEAARWLARLHATPAPQSDHLLRHEARHLDAVIDRALAREPALASIEPAAREAAARLAAAPQVLVHGEAYPSNLLVDGGRIRPIDLETVGTGAAALDLAALTSGGWAPEERARVLAAYDGATTPEELEAARLMVALQWLGWSASWTAPPEHRHDWLAEALAR
jgi:aminoglycoside phosphotransferase (APT) family kinase protein